MMNKVVGGGPAEGVVEHGGRAQPRWGSNTQSLALSTCGICAELISDVGVIRAGPVAVLSYHGTYVCSVVRATGQPWL